MTGSRRDETGVLVNFLREKLKSITSERKTNDGALAVLNDFSVSIGGARNTEEVAKEFELAKQQLKDVEVVTKTQRLSLFLGVKSAKPEGSTVYSLKTTKKMKTIAENLLNDFESELAKYYSPDMSSPVSSAFNSPANSPPNSPGPSRNVSISYEQKEANKLYAEIIAQHIDSPEEATDLLQKVQEEQQNQKQNSPSRRRR